MKQLRHAAAILAAGAVLALGLALPAAAGPNRNYGAHLTGDAEIPPVETLAQGQIHLKLSKDGTELSYKLIVANLDNVTMAHLHLAPVDDEGDIVAFLFHGPTVEGTSNGVLAEGTITAADLIGPLEGMPLSVLVDMIEAGNIYANVHTTANPGGEIRGQIR